MAPSEAVQGAQTRANLYRIFAAFFLLPPSEEFLCFLASSPIVPFSVDRSWKESELHQEFHSLFLVPTEGCVLPYESCYRGRRGDRPGRLMGKPALEVQEFYRQAGFDLAPETSELPDQAGLEFGMLQLLAERETAAWWDGDEHQARHWLQLRREFLTTHPAQWIPALCAEIVAKTAHPYFRAFARWIANVVKEVNLAEDNCTCAGSERPQHLRHGKSPSGQAERSAGSSAPRAVLLDEAGR